MTLKLNGHSIDLGGVGLGRLNYFSLNDEYARTEDGCPGVLTDQDGAETSITMSGKTKTIGYYYGCRKSMVDPIYPQELTNFERRIDEVAGTQQWLNS